MRKRQDNDFESNPIPTRGTDCLYQNLTNEQTPDALKITLLFFIDSGLPLCSNL